MKSKKVLINLISMTIIILCSIGIIIFSKYILSNNDNKVNNPNINSSNSVEETIINDKINIIKEDISKTIDGILNCDFNDIYAYNRNKSPFIIINPEKTMYPDIFERVTYEIANIDEKNYTATLVFKSPDVYKIIQQIPEKYETDKITKENLYEDLKNAQIIKKEVTVNLDYNDNHWYIITDGYFVDALTGGIISIYSDTEYEAYQKLLNK